MAQDRDASASPNEAGEHAPVVDAAAPVGRPGRRLRVVAVAACAIATVTFGVAVTRHRAPSAGSDGPSSTRALLAGPWVSIITGATPWRLTLTFAADGGDGFTLEGPCGASSAAVFTVDDGRLRAPDGLSTGSEPCASEAAATYVASVAALLTSEPVITLDACDETDAATWPPERGQRPAVDCDVLTLADFPAFVRPEVIDVYGSTPPSPTTTSVANLARLDGHTFALEGLTDAQGAGARLPATIARLTFRRDRVDVRLNCNGGSGPARIDGTTLVVTDLVTTAVGCRADPVVDEFTALLRARPTIWWAGGEMLTLSHGDVMATLVEAPEDQSTPPTTTAEFGVVQVTTTVAVPSASGPNMPVVVPAPDLGSFDDDGALVAALRASGPLDNQADAATAPNVSICADVLRKREPASGTLVHEAVASLRGEVGVVLVLRRSDGSLEARLYSTGAADPVTGGCRLLLSAAL